MLPDIDSFWDFNDAPATERAFRDLLPSCQEDENYKVELLTQIARAQGLQRKFDEAAETLEEAKVIQGDKINRACVRLLLERGRVLNSSGNKMAALPIFVEAYRLARQLAEDELAVDAAHMVAIAETGDEVLRWNLLALEVAETSEQAAAQKWRKSLHNNLGWTYHGTGDYEIALGHFEKCRQAAEDLGDAEAERIARWSRARVLRSMGRYQEALDQQRLQLRETEGRDVPFVQAEMGECLLALGQAEEAKPYFARAYELLSKDIWMQVNESERLQRFKEHSV